jgi:mRNA interferase RelE/StbE
MKIILSPRAEKELRKLSKLNQIAVAKKIRLAGNGLLSKEEEKLRGYKKIYRIRVGDNRIVYRRFEDEMYIILIGHRKDVYKIAGRLLD